MRTSDQFLDALHSGRVLLMDGAMGTELQRAGIRPGECYELWNLTHADRVLAIQRAYADARADVLLTNTFQANPANLAKHQRQEQLAEICSSAVTIARQAANGRTWVLGDIGPLANASGDLDHVQKSLGGCDALLLETWTNAANIGGAIPSLPLLVSLTFCHNAAGELQTFQNLTPEQVAEETASKRIAALGVNCGREITMEDCAEIIRRYRTVTQLPLFARPNAGTPKMVDGHWVYPRSPEQMAGELPRLLEAGAAMIGGCCGTTPAYIVAFRVVVDDWNRRHGY